MSFMDDFRHLKIQLKDIRLATNDFGDTPIGKGGFGDVFKGELSLPEGKKMVAFKRLDRRPGGQGDTEFWKERILVYEYASRGSLDCYLGKTSLTWNQLLKICHGAACGLNYLHDPVMHQRVLHRDVKSSNILLDENLTAKISDFGLSKIGPANQQYTYLVSNVVGTHGYCDPVYMEMGFLSKESDVYSFGVVLFEVICGKHCFEYCNGELKILVSLWKELYEEDKIDDIVSNNLKEQMDMDSCKTFLNIAYRCLNRDRKERPTMVEIIKELNVALDLQEMSQDVDEKAKYEERKSLANQAAIPVSYRSRNELASVLSKGILLKGGHNVIVYPSNTNCIRRPNIGHHV
ncbi:probable receptor-like protein kinase At2g23200 [Helianthus annuus]|uniref:probable receptor-like protein kinase At2g23200 n=1 Tax=Helianthus annuus TaxID=4232 RepID=UPI000B9046A0|nr:probable receptor-like protein kinase At2g23200 [Helianthus annuus]